jgi:integrase
MTVRIVPARGGGWEYDLRIHWPEGGRARERAKAPVASKSAALRWAMAREASILAAGKAAFRAPVAPPAVMSSVPTLAEFWPRVVRDHYKANRKKPSTIDAAESIYRNHLAGQLGAKRLDEITDGDIAALKGRLIENKPSTVNNILSVLSRTLGCAVKWRVLPAMPCELGFFKVDNEKLRFYERDEYRRLVEATWSPASRALVLLAGSAGLRRGEIIALRWANADLARRQLEIRANVWRNIEGTTKGGKSRVVPMTAELAETLAALKRGRTVVSVDGDDHVLAGLTPRRVRNWIARAERRAGLAVGTAREVRDSAGGIHVLRHTFCSHLAIAGVPAMAIKELAGHADLATTQRYMHLSPRDRDGAMATLAAYYHERAGSNGGAALARGS